MSPGLSDDRAETWRTYRRMHLMLMSGLDRQLSRDSGMPQGYFAVLAALAGQPDGRLVLSELARKCNFSQSRLSHAMTRMEEAGWVVREQSTSSRRSTYARLTETGRRIQHEAAGGHDRAVRELFFDGLTSDQEHQFRHLCTLISTHMAEREIS